MSVKSFRPTSPAVRNMTVADFSGLTKKAPEKALLISKGSQAGRNSYGRITVRHHGGGNKQKIRLIDWKRNKDTIPAKVAALEYDPRRTAHIALLYYADGAKAYILAPEGLHVGDTVVSGVEADIKAGNCLPLENIPVGSMIHDIEMKPGKGAQLVRTAGAAAQLLAKEENGFAVLRLPSGEMRKILLSCRATIGVVSNAEHENVKIGKAGKTRHMGRRPYVRGVVMNPNDHPHGGGEGKSPIGLPSPVTPWGKPTLGYKTRKHNKKSDRLIVKRCKD